MSGTKRLYAIIFEGQILVAAPDEAAALDLAEAVARDNFYATSITLAEAAQTGLYVYIDEGKDPLPLRQIAEDLRIVSRSS